MWVQSEPNGLTSAGVILNIHVFLHTCKCLDSELSCFHSISVCKESHWLYAGYMSKISESKVRLTEQPPCKKKLLFTAFHALWTSFGTVSCLRTRVPVQYTTISSALPNVSTMVTSTLPSNSMQSEQIGSWKWLALCPAFVFFAFGPSNHGKKLEHCIFHFMLSCDMWI